MGNSSTLHSMIIGGIIVAFIVVVIMIFQLKAGSYQHVVIVIAGVLLVITLIIVAITIRPGIGNVQWPPEVGDCPDYFLLSGGGGSGVGSGGTCSNVKGLGNKGSGCNSYATTPLPKKHSAQDAELMKRCKWAQQCGLTWDGITNQGYC